MQDILDFKSIKHNASPLSIPSSLTPDYVRNPFLSLRESEAALASVLEEALRVILGGHLAQECDVFATVAQDGVLLARVHVVQVSPLTQAINGLGVRLQSRGESARLLVEKHLLLGRLDCAGQQPHEGVALDSVKTEHVASVLNATVGKESGHRLEEVLGAELCGGDLLQQLLDKGVVEFSGLLDDADIVGECQTEPDVAT